MKVPEYTCTANNNYNNKMILSQSINTTFFKYKFMYVHYSTH